MRGARIWLITAAVMVAGSVAAHVAGDLMGTSPDGDRGEAAPSGSHLLAGSVPLAAGVVGVLLAAAVLALAARRITASARRALPWSVWMLPIAGFLVQEALERVNLVELPAFTAAHDPSAFSGALVQVPFALALVWLARRLARAARLLADRLGRHTQHRLRRGSASWLPPPSVRLPRIACLALGYPQRGPPYLLS